MAPDQGGDWGAVRRQTWPYDSSGLTADMEGYGQGCWTPQGTIGPFCTSYDCRPPAQEDGQPSSGTEAARTLLAGHNSQHVRGHKLRGYAGGCERAL